MNLSEVKKSEVDEIGFVEKTLLAAHAITWMAYRASQVYEQQKVMLSYKDKEGFPKDTMGVLKKSIKDFEDEFNEVIAALIKITEQLGNFVDGKDMIDAVDTVVTEPAFDILYERYAPEAG